MLRHCSFWFLVFCFIQVKAVFSSQDLVNISDVQLPFSRGETIEYAIYLKNVSVGRGELVFEGIRDCQGKDNYFVTFTTGIFNIKDIERICVDRKRFLPLRIDREIRKTGLPDEIITEIYDQQEFKVHIDKKVLFSRRKMVIEKDSYIHNVILLAYYFRLLPQEHFKKNFSVHLPTVKMDISFKGQEEVKLSSGTYQAYVFEGQPKNFRFYISTDQRRLPLRIENPGYSMVLVKVAESGDLKDEDKEKNEDKGKEKEEDEGEEKAIEDRRPRIQKGDLVPEVPVKGRSCL